MSSENDVTASLTFGVIFITIGILVVLNELDVLTLRWAYILPITLILAGLAVIISTQVNAYMRR
jgi:hypothetical protein